jgi:hypothetical protein
MCALMRNDQRPRRTLAAARILLMPQCRTKFEVNASTLTSPAQDVCAAIIRRSLVPRSLAKLLEKPHGMIER